MNQKWFFYSQEDRDRIQQSGKTDWGSLILENLRHQVEEHLAQGADAPLKEGTTLSDYFCPLHNRFLAFDWQSPHAHYCPDCHSYLTGERYDRAWCEIVHRRNQAFLRNATILYIATRNRICLDYIRTGLLAYAEQTAGFRIHNSYMEPDAPCGGRIFCESLGDSVWVTDVAPAFVEAMPVMTPAEAESVRRHVFRPTVSRVYWVWVLGFDHFFAAHRTTKTGIHPDPDSIFYCHSTYPLYSRE